MLTVGAYIIIGIISIFVWNRFRRIAVSQQVTVVSPNVAVIPLLLIGIFLVCAPSGLASAATAFWNNSFVVVGSDSINFGVSGRRTICKLERVDDVFLSVIGTMSGIPDGRGNLTYDAMKTAREAMRASKGGHHQSIAERYKVCESRLKVELRRVVDIAREAGSDEYQRWKNGRHIIEVVIVGVERDLPILIITVFDLDKNETIKPNQLHTSESPSPIEFGYYFGSFARETPAPEAVLQLRMTGPEKAAEWVIQRTIDRHPDDVGPPIAIVRVDGGRGGGLKWVKRPPYCAE